MNREIKFTLLTDGSSDRVLTPVLAWIIEQHMPDTPILARFADLRKLPKPPKKLKNRIERALEYYPCDILFIHRDAEKESYELRRDEINDVWQKTSIQTIETVKVAVIPVRMSETWLLFDINAIKAASGNPNSTIKLTLPKANQLEKEANPKVLLHTAIRKASGLSGRNLDKLNVHQAVHLVAEYTEDYSPLRNLPAFQKLEEEIKDVLNKNYPS